MEIYKISGVNFLRLEATIQEARNLLVDHASAVGLSKDCFTISVIEISELSTKEEIVNFVNDLLIEEGW